MSFSHLWRCGPIPRGSTPVYPEKPRLSQDAIYVASIGVSRYERESLERITGSTDFRVNSPEAGVLVGSTSGLYSLDRRTDKVQWRIVPGRTVFSPTVSDGITYAGDRSGVVRAIDTGTGDIRWSR